MHGILLVPHTPDAEPHWLSGWLNPRCDVRSLPVQLYLTWPACDAPPPRPNSTYMISLRPPFGPGLSSTAAKSMPTDSKPSTTLKTEFCRHGWCGHGKGFVCRDQAAAYNSIQICTTLCTASKVHACEFNNTSTCSSLVLKSGSRGW